MNNTTEDFIINKKIPRVYEGTAFFSVMSILLFFGFGMFSYDNFYLREVAGEFILILLPTILFIVLFKFDIKIVLKLNRIKISNILIIPMLLISSLPIVGILNILYLRLLKMLFGSIDTSNIIPTNLNNLWEIILGILVIGGIAALCEEPMFRGVLQTSFFRLGPVCGIFLPALLFGLFHMDLQKFFGTFILGILIGFIVYRTDSIFGGMLAHFTNNTISILLVICYNHIASNFSSKIALQINQIINVSNFSSSPTISNIKIAILDIFALGIIVLLFSFILYIFIKNTTATAHDTTKKCENCVKIRELLFLVPGFIMIGFVYLLQYLHLTGNHIAIIDKILKFLGIT